LMYEERTPEAGESPASPLVLVLVTYPQVSQMTQTTRHPLPRPQDAGFEQWAVPLPPTRRLDAPRPQDARGAKAGMGMDDAAREPAVRGARCHPPRCEEPMAVVVGGAWRHVCSNLVRVLLGDGQRVRAPRSLLIRSTRALWYVLDAAPCRFAPFPQLWYDASRRGLRLEWHTGKGSKRGRQRPQEPLCGRLRPTHTPIRAPAARLV
jgi:hypothetical protein